MIKLMILFGLLGQQIAAQTIAQIDPGAKILESTLNAGMNKYQRINHLEEKLIALYKRVNLLESQVNQLRRELKKNTNIKPVKQKE